MKEAGVNILVIGGSVFLGKNIVEAALARGHHVTVFNRGSRKNTYSKPVDHVQGDRSTDLHRLQGRRFDSVIDCCAYTPEHMALAADALMPLTGHYVFVSTISVYSRFPPGETYDETAAVCQGHTGYGAQKARAEEVIEAAFPGRVAHVRPGLIVGPDDPSGRFAYWPLRVAAGGAVLAPGRPARLVHYIDVRDLAAWCLALAEAKTAGMFNAAGPSDTMRNFLKSCQQVCNPLAEFYWVDDAVLTAAQVAPWTGLPLWIPESDADYGGMLLADCSRARQAGLTTRPWEETIRDTLRWAQDHTETSLGTACISRATEATLIASAGH
jgi:2'-hydroxyisoflavone reductase